MESHKTTIYVVLLLMGGYNKPRGVMLWPHVHYEVQDILRPDLLIANRHGHTIGHLFLAWWHQFTSRDCVMIVGL